MEINVNNQVRVKDGERHKVLLPSKNPHEVGAKVGADLIKAGLATETGGGTKAKTTKASGTTTETGGGTATEGDK